jgi:hypothetical protein
MLRLVWETEHAGAPDNKDYKAAQDALWLKGGAAPLQGIAKTSKGVVALNQAAGGAVRDFAAGLPADRRAVVLVHGYAFEPDPDSDVDEVAEDDPYEGVYSEQHARDPEQAGIGGYIRNSWLNFVDPERAVAFAWTSTGSFGDYGKACWTNPYEYAVLDIAPGAAKALAGTIAALADQGRQIDVVAHSLGTRTAMRALDLLGRAGRRGDVQRAILLSGAEYSLDAKQAARQVDTDAFNFMIRDDWVLKWGASELGGGGLRPNNTVQARVIGRDGVQPSDRWLDLRLDHADPEDRAQFRAWFKARHMNPSAEPKHRGAHWTAYLNAGNQRMLKRILDDPEITAARWLEEGVPDGGGWFNYGRNLKGRPPTTPQTCRGRKQAQKR